MYGKGVERFRGPEREKTDHENNYLASFWKDNKQCMILLIITTGTFYMFIDTCKDCVNMFKITVCCC